MGESTFGPYRVGARLGAGAMGEVHRAYDTRREREVALKRITVDEPGLEQRFRRESRIAARLNSPHVIPIHDFGVIERRLYIDMRLVDGTDLSGLLKRTGPLPPARAAAIVAQIADALDAAHASGLVHRDVKPSNALLTAGRQDFVYLADFGIVHESDPDGTRLTATGSTLGTPAYMAPEQLRAERIDHRVDVYALGCVLFELLTGRTPFVASSVPVLASQHLTSRPEPPSRLRPELPRALDDAVLGALEKRPADRPSSAGELADLARRATARPEPLRGPDRRTVTASPVATRVSADERADEEPGPWNRASVASAVLGVLVPVLGVAAGLVGLRQTKAGLERGRALAWAGIVVGATLTVATVVVVVVYLSLTPSVSRATIETQIARRTGVPVSDVRCDQRLPAVVGASVSCTVGADGRQIVRATTTAVNDEGTDFSLVVE